MKYLHIGWCREDKHDKVWGIIKIHDNECLTFWGRRGFKLQTKLIYIKYLWEATDLFSKKQKKGYKEIQESELDKVYPEFKNDLEKTAIWAALKL